VPRAALFVHGNAKYDEPACDIRLPVFGGHMPEFSFPRSNRLNA
jgi:hypothetical protein